jgi:hypothetical protein
MVFRDLYNGVTYVRIGAISPQKKNIARKQNPYITVASISLPLSRELYRAPS